MSIHLGLKHINLLIQQQSDCGSSNWIKIWDNVNDFYLARGDKDYRMKHIQLLPGKLTLQMLMGYFLGIFWIPSTSR